MAYVPLQSKSGVVIKVGAQTQYEIYNTPVIKDAAGDPVDFSTWDSVKIDLFENGANDNEGVVVASEINPLTLNADGTISWANSDFFSALASGAGHRKFGSYPYTMFGKPTSGDPFQNLMSGTFNYQLLA